MNPTQSPKDECIDTEFFFSSVHSTHLFPLSLAKMNAYIPNYSFHQSTLLISSFSPHHSFHTTPNHYPLVDLERGEYAPFELL